MTTDPVMTSDKEMDTTLNLTNLSVPQPPLSPPSSPGPSECGDSKTTPTTTPAVARRKKEKKVCAYTSPLPPCKICGAKASGLHYGVNTCEACKGFFRRAIKFQKKYRCFRQQACDVTGGRSVRTSCPFCRLQKCLNMGMAHTAIKTGRYTHAKRTENIMEVKRLEFYNNTPLCASDKDLAYLRPGLNKQERPQNRCEEEQGLWLQPKMEPKEEIDSGEGYSPCMYYAKTEIPDSLKLDKVKAEEELTYKDYTKSLDTGVKLYLDEASSDLTSSEWDTGFMGTHSGEAYMVCGEVSAPSVLDSSPLPISDSSSFSNCDSSPLSMDVEGVYISIPTPPLSIDSQSGYSMSSSSPSSSSSSSSSSSISSSLSYGSDSGCLHQLYGPSAVPVVGDDATSFTSSITNMTSQDFTNLTPYPPVPSQCTPSPTSYSAYIPLPISNTFHIPTASPSCYAKEYPSDSSSASSLLKPWMPKSPLFELDDMENLNSLGDEKEKIIERLIQGHKENAITLAEYKEEFIHELQMKYVENHKARDETFGPMSPFLSDEVYEEIFNKTGLDVDDRRKRKQFVYRSTCAYIVSITNFARSIPGFTSLVTHDQFALIKTSKMEQWFLNIYKGINPSLSVVVMANLSVYSMSELTWMINREFTELCFMMAPRFQALGIDYVTLVLWKAIMLFSTDRAELDEPEKVSKLQTMYANILMSHLENQKPSKAGLFSSIIDCSMRLRSLEEFTYLPCNLPLLLMDDIIRPIVNGERGISSS